MARLPSAWNCLFIFLCILFMILLVTDYRQKGHRNTMETVTNDFIRKIEDDAEKSRLAVQNRRSKIIEKKDAAEVIGVEDLDTYWRYVTTMTGKCDNTARLGPGGDTGYTACEDKPFKPREPCLVYSFGSHFLFGFEEGVIRRYHCEVHTFDPSIPIQGHKIPSGINFHLIGLSSKDFTNVDGWKMQNLSSIRKDLGHSERILDILKLDIEGSEWLSIPEMIQSGIFKYVKQLLVEFHFGLKLNPTTNFKSYHVHNYAYVSNQHELEVLRKLYNLTSFRSFADDTNELARIPFKNNSLTTCHVVSFVNTQFHE